MLDFLNQSVTRKIENKIISSASEIEITEDGFYKAHLSVRGRDDGDILCNHLEFKSIEELATSPGIAIEQGGEAVIFRLSNAKGTAEELEAYIEANGGICFDYVKEVFTEEKYSDSVLSPKRLFSKDYSAIQLLTEGIPKKFYVEYVNTEEI